MYRWFNFVTGKEVLRAHPPTTDDEAQQYIPQDIETLGLYWWIRDQGESPASAIRTIITRDLNAWHPRNRSLEELRNDSHCRH